MTETTLNHYKTEITNELHELLNWWIKNTIDEDNDGFYGRIDDKGVLDPLASKGLVLNARILYTFSSAYLLTKRKEYLFTAVRAFNYLIDHFSDPVWGGFYWSVNYFGQIEDGKKQVYGQAFAIYGLTEYYKATRNEKALNMAIATFEQLEKYSYDPIHTGYLEAFTKDWQPIEDLRLSAKDQNEKKTMNTHLHVIEAYANLYSVWKDKSLKATIKQLLDNFKTNILDPKTHHLQLFFTETWEVKSSLVSFGHDIEAAWLLQEAAESIADAKEITTFKDLALKITDAATQGIDPNGALWEEYDYQNEHWKKEIHWWPQAEAMVGFLNAYQLSGNKKYLTNALNSWQFIKNYLIDKEHGEWYWGVKSDYSVMQGEDKAGFWKCPYHNGRACIEVIKRLDKLKL